jgi:hypothetical protein
MDVFDNYSNKIMNKLDLKKYILPRAKAGKVLKLDANFNSLYRGFDNNYKLLI